MKKTLCGVILIAVLGISQSYGNTFFLFMKVLNSDGATGTTSTANSFSSVSVYRIGIANQIGHQEAGPNAKYAASVYPALHNNLNIPAYLYSDVGTYDWTTIEDAGQTIVAVAEVFNPQFGWTGNSYAGCGQAVLSDSDVNNNHIELPDAGLQLIPQPQIIQLGTNSITVGWTRMTVNNIYGYTLYRAISPAGTYSPITVVPQNTGNQIQYMDNYNIANGTTYYYKISVDFAWGGGNGAQVYYETKAVSAASLQPGSIALNPNTEKITPAAEEMSESNTYNFPNPCSGPTTIRFSLPEPTDVSMGIYDINGRLVWSKRISAASANAGVNYVIWNLQNGQGNEVSNGVYLLIIKAGNKVVTKKIAVVH